MISYRILIRQRIPISYRKLCEATGINQSSPEKVLDKVRESKLSKDKR
jgi:hypothetical protein